MLELEGLDFLFFGGSGGDKGTTKNLSGWSSYCI